MSNWHTKVPKARGFVKDRETGDPLVLDENGDAWRQDPNKPGEAQRVGRYMPSLWEMIDKSKQESKRVELPPVEVNVERPKPAAMPPPRAKGKSGGSDAQGNPIFEGPETEIRAKPKKKKDKKVAEEEDADVPSLVTGIA